MSGQRRWTIGLAATTGIFGLTVTGTLAFIGHYFMKELSRPHALLPESVFTWSMPQAVGEPPPALQHSLLFNTVDGTLLRGDFWAQLQPAPTIILCHGYRISRSHLRPAAAMEYASGYNVLFFDFRGHGESESVLTSAGNAEVHDLEAAIYAAHMQPETLPGKIILHGFSMGAAVALLTPPHPDVIAIIADSPYARLDEIMRRLVSYQLEDATNRWRPRFRPSHQLVSTLSWLLVAVSSIEFRLRFGFNVGARPDNSFKRRKIYSKQVLQQQNVPILLIHSAGDKLIPIEHARHIAAEARAQGVTLETYFVDADAHCGAYDYDPQRYNTVLLDFLEHHLQDALPKLHRRPSA